MSINFHKYYIETSMDSELSGTTRHLYDYMLGLSRLDNGQVRYYSIKRLSQGIRRNPATTRRHLNKLVKLGYVSRQYQWDANNPCWEIENLYTVHPVRMQNTIEQTQSPSKFDSTPYQNSIVPPIKNQHGNNRGIRESINNTLKEGVQPPLKTYEKETNPVQETIKATEATGTAQTASSPDKDETLSGIPEVMRPTVRYFLFRTGRKTFSQSDLEALRSVAQKHTPARIQKEIDVAVERFIRTHRRVSKIAFAYIAKSLKDQKSYEKGVTDTKGKKTSIGNKKATKQTSEQKTTESTTLQVKERTLSLEEAKKVISNYVPPVKEHTSVPPALQELHNKICDADQKLDEQYMDSKYEKDEYGYIIPDDDDLDFEHPSISLEDYLRLKFPNATEKERSLDRAYDENGVRKAFEFDKQCAHCSGLNECPFNRKCGRPFVTIENGMLYTRYTTTTPCRYDVAKPDPELQRRIKRSGLTEFQLKQTFTAYKNNSAETIVIKAKAILAAKNKTSLVLAGKPGTGKTHLAIAIAIDAMQHGRQAIITTMPDMLNELKDADWTHTDFFGVMRKFREVDCLVLDDWGKEKITEKGLEYLYQLINSRYTHGRQTIVTTNFLNPDDLGDVEKIEPLLSRLLENGEWVSIREIENYRLRTDEESEVVAEVPTEVEATSEPEKIPEPEIIDNPETVHEPMGTNEPENTVNVPEPRITSGEQDEDGFRRISSILGGKAETPEPETKVEPKAMVKPETVAEPKPEGLKPEEPAPEAPKDIYRYFPTYDSLSNSDKKECIDWLARERPMIDELKAQEDKSQSDLLRRYCPNYFTLDIYNLNKIRLWIIENSKWVRLTAQEPPSTPESSITSEAPVASENSSGSSLTDNDDLWEEDEDEYRLYGDTGIPVRDYPIDEDIEPD